MGTDIHLRVEYRVPGETVALVNGEITVVPAEGLEGAPRWAPAEKLTPKEQVESNKYYLARLNDPDVKAEWDEKPSMELAYTDRFYHGRHYDLFRSLAGVRGHGVPGVWEDRGFPTDASDEVREDYQSWGFDGHTPSWQTLAELLAYDWDELGNDNWLTCLERMKNVADTLCDGDQTAVRIVYWFDN